MELCILYSDQYLVVVEKPGGLLSVPGRGADKQDCVVNRIRHLFPKIIDQPSVHRLDMDTSGLMVLAFTQASHKELSGQFQAHRVHKKYFALLDGTVTGTSGEIHLPFRLDPDNRPYQVYDPVHGKWGRTFWKKIHQTNYTTRIQFTPITGRTHQLRLHASHPQGLGCPIIGDRLYGYGVEGDQLMLHASSLSFVHPVQRTVMSFDSPPPF